MPDRDSPTRGVGMGADPAPAKVNDVVGRHLNSRRSRFSPGRETPYAGNGVPRLHAP